VNVLGKVGAFVDENGGGWAMDDVMMRQERYVRRRCCFEWLYGHLET
jgi:hypothetical protein